MTRALPEVEDAVVEGKLKGDIGLKINRPANRTTGGKKQMVVIGEIINCAQIERGALIWEIRFELGLMINFSANG